MKFISIIAALLVSMNAVGMDQITAANDPNIHLHSVFLHVNGVPVPNNIDIVTKEMPIINPVLSDGYHVHQWTSIRGWAICDFDRNQQESRVTASVQLINADNNEWYYWDSNAIDREYMDRGFEFFDIPIHSFHNLKVIFQFRNQSNIPVRNCFAYALLRGY